MGKKSEGTMQINALINAAFQAMLDNTESMIFVKDANLIYRAASMPWVRMAGKQSLDEIINHTDTEIFADENLAKRYISDDHKLLADGKNLENYMEPITDDNGQARYGSTSKYILRDESGEVIGILGITKDITRDYIVRQHYQQELKYLFKMPKDTYAVSYIDIDDWRLISQRKQLIEEGTLESCYTVESLCEAAVEAIIDRGSTAAEFYHNFKPCFLRRIYGNGRSHLSFKYQRRLTDGSLHWIHNEIRFLIDVDSGHLCAMLSAKNIDEEKLKEQQLAEAAEMDRMTRLLNRETTMEYIRQIFIHEDNLRHALFMIDADNFKSLNDTQGHRTGDEFLITFASEIKKCFGENDIVGRVGGDEFFVLMRDIPGDEETKEKAEQLLSVIQQVCANYPAVQLSASIGVGMYPENGKTLEELYTQADRALYQAKGMGKNQIVFA